MNRLFLLAAALLSLQVSCGKKESYAYDYVGATLRVESSSPTHVTYMIVCELKNEMTDKSVNTIIYDDIVVYGNVTLVPTYESTEGGLWSESSRTVPKGCQMRAYINGTLIGSVYVN